MNTPIERLHTALESLGLRPRRHEGTPWAGATTLVPRPNTGSPNLHRQPGTTHSTRIRTAVAYPLGPHLALGSPYRNAITPYRLRCPG
jgi:hypothetical protein